MQVADYRKLGLLPLQDHRPDTDPENRAAVMAGRIESRDDFLLWTVEGHQESTSDRKTVGDLLGGFHIEPEAPGEEPASGVTRKQGAWFFAGAGITTEAVKGEAPAAENGTPSTRTRADQDAFDAPAEVKWRPVADGEWAPDERFKEATAVLHPDAGDLPKGTPLIVLATTEERTQTLLGLPVQANKLIAVNNAGDPLLGTLVYDLTDEDEPDPGRRARLHTFWRVIKLAGGCALGANDALAWQLGQSGQDKLDGRGLVVDTGGVKSTGQGISPEPGGVPSDGEAAEGTQIGAVTLVADFLREQADRIRRAQSGATPNQGADDPNRTRTRTRGNQVTSQPRAPNDQPGETVTTVANSPLVVAATSARSGGMIEVGDAADVHRIGFTRDGQPVNCAHLPTTALWKNSIGDGPLDFEPFDYEEPQIGSPFLTPVHLRWDNSVSHPWTCGTAPGRWRWAAESFFYIPEDKTKSPPPPLPPPPPPPPPPPDPPPRECQRIPGGGRPRHPRPPSTPGGGAPGGEGGTDFIPGGINYDDVLPPWLGTGQDAITNADPPPATGAVSTGPVDPGVGIPSPDGPVTTPDTTQPTGPSDGPGRQTGRTVTRDPGGTTTTDGGPSDPTRTRQKAGVGGNPGGAFTGGVAGPAGRVDVGGRTPSGGRTEDMLSDPQRGPTCGDEGGDPTELPPNTCNVFGGGEMAPSVLLALRAEGVVDAHGRATRAPPPRVGDGRVSRVFQLGGVESRTPTAAQTVSFGGGVTFGAYATAQGQEDFTRGGWIADSVHLQAAAGSVGGITGFATSPDGKNTGGLDTWEGLRASESSAEIQGGLVFGPSSVTRPENLAKLLAGDFHPVAQEQLTTTPRGIYYPGGLACVFFGHPSSTSGSGVTGAGAVRLDHLQFGLRFQPFKADATEATQAYSIAETAFFCEGGAKVALQNTANTTGYEMGIDGAGDLRIAQFFGAAGPRAKIVGDAEVTGKLTVGGLIDPTGLILAEQAADPMSGADVGLFAGDTTGANEAFWRRDDGTIIDLATSGGATTFLALTDTPGVFVADAGVRVNAGATALEFSDPPGTRAIGPAVGPQTIPNNTVTALDYDDSETFDDDAWHDLVTNPSRITVNRTGRYSVMGRATWVGNATGVRAIRIHVNGALVARATNQLQPAGTEAFDSEINDMLALTAGDYVEVFVLQTSGGNLGCAPTAFVVQRV